VKLTIFIGQEIRVSGISSKKVELQLLEVKPRTAARTICQPATSNRGYNTTMDAQMCLQIILISE
jgi:hypothetical protein